MALGGVSVHRRRRARPHLRRRAARLQLRPGGPSQRRRAGGQDRPAGGPPPPSGAGRDRVELGHGGGVGRAPRPPSGRRPCGRRQPALRPVTTAGDVRPAPHGLRHVPVRPYRRRLGGGRSHPGHPADPGGGGVEPHAPGGRHGSHRGPGGGAADTSGGRQHVHHPPDVPAAGPGGRRGDPLGHQAAGGPRRRDPGLHRRRRPRPGRRHPHCGRDLGRRPVAVRLLAGRAGPAHLRGALRPGRGQRRRRGRRPGHAGRGAGRALPGPGRPSRPGPGRQAVRLPHRDHGELRARRGAARGQRLPPGRRRHPLRPHPGRRGHHDLPPGVVVAPGAHGGGPGGAGHARGLHPPVGRYRGSRPAHQRADRRRRRRRAALPKFRSSSRTEYGSGS